MSRKKICIIVLVILLSVIALVSLIIETLNRDGESQGAPTTNTGNAGLDESTGQCESLPDVGEYREVTNNQVEGVIEGDIFKRSTNYIWSLHKLYTNNDKTGLTLSAYLIGNDPKAKPFELIIESETGIEFMGTMELYLSADVKTVTILSSCYKQTFDENGNLNFDDTTKIYTVIISIDVSDPTAPKEISRRYVSGGLISSRLADGKLLLVTERILREPDFSNPEEFLPQAGTLDNMKSLPLDDFVPPENADSINYTVVSAFDVKNTETMDAVVLFSDTEAVYVSQDRIFTARSYYEKDDDYTVKMSEITYISYRNELTVEGCFTVEGTVLDQYSFDEKDGVLRLFTVGSQDENYNSSCVDYDPAPPPVLSGNLFCIKLGLGGFQTLSIVRDFASGYERFFSVHFDGDKVYVYVGKHDGSLLYEFDFSDDSNVTWKETSVPSCDYSMKLVNFYGDTLVGISCREWGYGRLKIEIFDANGDAIESVAAFELENVDVFSDFKDYFIDAEHGIIGFTFYQRLYPSYSYHDAFILLRFDGEKLTELFSTSGYYFNTRACIIDGYIYILDDWKLTVEKLYFLN